jgi:hypothetical protein
VPPEKIVEPNPRVAVPAAQALTYSLGDELVREMFANLMAADMSADSKAGAHPAFVELIKEMTPLDARILYVLQGRPQIEFISQLATFQKSRDVGWSLSFSIAGVSTYRMREGVGNLIRLGLVEKHRDGYPDFPDFQTRAKEILEELKTAYTEKLEDEEFLKNNGLDKGTKPQVTPHGLYLTPFGTSFVQTCLVGAARVSAIADDLHRYMAFRARSEGVAYTLDPAFFRDQLNAGVRKFFGVVVEHGALVHDEQQPALFREWRSSARAH